MIRQSTCRVYLTNKGLSCDWGQSEIVDKFDLLGLVKGEQMKKLGVIVITTLLSVCNQIYAKSYMPSLERLRNKVDDIMQSGSVTSLKTVLERAKLQGFSPGQGGTTILSAQGVVSKNDTEPACKLQQIQAKAQEMVWASNVDFVTQLQILTNDEQKEAITKLVLEKISNSKLPLIDFIIQLRDECDWLEQAKPECTKLLLTKIAQGGKKFHEQTREMLQKVNSLLQNLQALMKIVNDLFVSEA